MTSCTLQQKGVIFTHRLLLFLTLFSCQEKKGDNAKQSKVLSKAPERFINKAVVKSVNFSITTYSDISCDVFDRQFPNADTVLVTDKTVLKELTKHLILFKKTDQKYPLDTRAKVIIYFSDSTISTICMSRFRMVLNGLPIEYDKKLSKLLKINVD